MQHNLRLALCCACSLPAACSPPLQALISGCTAFFHPASLAWITTQQFEWGVGLLMLAMGLSLTKEDFKRVSSSGRARQQPASRGMAAAGGDSRTQGEQQGQGATAEQAGGAPAVVPSAKAALRQQRRNQSPLHTRLLCTTPSLLWLTISSCPA